MKFLRRTFDNLSIPVIAVLLGLVASSLFVALANVSPIDTYQRLFCEGFGPRGCETFGDLVFIEVENEDGSLQTVFSPLYGSGGSRIALILEQITPLILTALSAAVAFQAGMFSIGMDGQFVMGAITVAFLGYALPDQIYMLAGVSDPEAAPEALKTAMHLIVPLICLSAAMAVGAIYSWIPGYFKVKLNVNVLISTIIFNAIAVQLVGYLVNYPLRSDLNNIARTRRIDDTAWLIPFNRGIFADVEWFSGARVGIGIFIALAAVALVWFYLRRTTAGYEQRMTRGSSLFARFGGIPTDRAALRAMLISGALSGLAGALAVLGVERRIVDGFATSGVGFEGVLVAILAKESIIGILLVAPFIAGLNLGATNLQFGDIPRQLGGIIISFIILFSAMEDFIRARLTALFKWRPTRQRSAPDGEGAAA
ncbi:MAG: ABC transporter permease [Pleurocapsa minor GSE-CHR-MK-17-07R]|jgi:simple sugar transport system permease protein|nr:ABC transporter permease [Pleurocapsa minor GSE-CHR-MK 17-07R]